MSQFMRIAVFVFIAIFSTSIAEDQKAPRLRVSENQHYLVTGDGQPFFWLGDTAWELFHRLNREEVVKYLEIRASQGFTVIQTVALAEFDGLKAPNAYGHLPLIEDDPTRPAIVDGPENDYWDHVDFVVREANQRGLMIGFLPTWGDKWNKKWGVGPEIFDAGNAEKYGEWLGRRYQSAGLVWILGGDRPVESDAHRAIIRAMATGLRRGDNGAHLMTYHPSGGQGSSQFFPDEPWLDFHMRQNGHEPEFNGRYEKTLDDYRRQPRKPVLDGEPIYEDHPVSFKAQVHGHSIAADVRRAMYWDLFSGAFGHTYGHHSMWQFFAPGRQPVNNPLLTWDKAIHQPGAEQMLHGKNLLLSRPFLTRIPDPNLIVADPIPTSIPGAGRYALVATRDEAGRYAMIYVPVGRSFRVRTSLLKAARLRAWWFNPRNGTARQFGDFDNAGELRFDPPDPGEQSDWVLVLDDLEQNYPAPGQQAGGKASTNHRIYLDEFRPRPELRVEEHLLTQAKYPCVNMHSHPEKLSDAEVAEMVAVMDSSNIAVSVSLDGQAGPKLVDQLARFSGKHPGRFVLFVRMDYIGDGNPDDPATWDMHNPDFGVRMADKLSEAVKLGAGGLKLLKDLGLKHKDREGKLIAPDDRRFDPVWQRAGELGVPVLWHCADPVAFFREGDVTNERWEELYRHPEWGFQSVDLSHLPPPSDLPPGVPAAHRQLIEARNRVIARHPRTQFICAHMADIPEDLTLLDRYLTQYPNMHVEISARISELGRQPYAARRFFLKHTDRILFGTDGVPPVSELIPHWRFLETFDENFPYEDNPFPPQGLWNIYGIGLPDEVLRKVYHENAVRLIPAVKKALDTQGDRPRK